MGSDGTHTHTRAYVYYMNTWKTLRSHTQTDTSLTLVSPPSAFLSESWQLFVQNGTHTSANTSVCTHKSTGTPSPRFGMSKSDVHRSSLPTSWTGSSSCFSTSAVLAPFIYCSVSSAHNSSSNQRDLMAYHFLQLIGDFYSTGGR